MLPNIRSSDGQFWLRRDINSEDDDGTLLLRAPFSVFGVRLDDNKVYPMMVGRTCGKLGSNVHQSEGLSFNNLLFLSNISWQHIHRKTLKFYEGS